MLARFEVSMSWCTAKWLCGFLPLNKGATALKCKEFGSESPYTMLIYIDAPHERTTGVSCDEHSGLCSIRLGLEVTGSETIGSLKAHLWDGGLIPRSKKIQLHWNRNWLFLVLWAGEKHLIFNGRLLDNRRTLSNYNIQKDAEISLPSKDKTILIPIRFPTGEMIRVGIEDIATIGDLKSRLQAEAYVPRGKRAEFWTITMEKRLLTIFLYRYATADLRWTTVTG